MRHTDYFHPALLALTAALLATAALDARPARRPDPIERQERSNLRAAPAARGEKNELDLLRACRPWVHQPDCETRFQP